MAGVGRAAIFLAVLALLGAWVSQYTGGSFLGLPQQHFFSDAIVLALLGIAFLVDGFAHRQGV